MLLVVDDDPTILRLVTRSLQPEYAVENAKSARRALGVLSLGGITAILSDLNLGHPIEDGVWLLREAARRWPATRRVLYTGAPTPAAGLAHIEGAIHSILHKPASRCVLVDALRCRADARVSTA